MVGSSIPSESPLNKSPKRIRRLIILSLLAIIVALGIWSVFIEPSRLVVHSEWIKIAHWPTELDDLKIVAIGDIHTGSPFIDEDKLRKIVSLTNEQQPDLIVLLGDYMVRSSSIDGSLSRKSRPGIEGSQSARWESTL